MTPLILGQTDIKKKNKKKICAEGRLDIRTNERSAFQMTSISICTDFRNHVRTQAEKLRCQSPAAWEY